MAKKQVLTVKQVEKLVRDMVKEGYGGRKNVGSYLYIDFAGGTQSWLFRYTFNEKQQWLGLGSLSDVSLAEARRKVEQNRGLVLQGINPAAQGKIDDERFKQQMQVTEKDFKYFGDALIESKRLVWKSPRTAQTWENTLKNYVYPFIGHLAITDIKTHHVADILKPIWFKKTVTASDTRGRIETIINYGKALLDIRSAENPALWNGNLEFIFPAEKEIHTVEHFPSMNFSELPQFMQRLNDQTCLSAKALMLTILTVPRTSEVIAARASEIDDGIWEIPAERMKKGIMHRVPLSWQARKLIDELTPVNDYLFPSPVKTTSEGLACSISTGAMDALLERMDRMDITVHGFRSSFETYMEEMHDFKENVTDTCLAHSLKDSNKGAYNRANYLDKRKIVMQVWADYVCGNLENGAI